jgi:hypothetical protein
MTDTNRGKQALSLTLTAIMVLSMVAIGLTTFAGSAAAVPSEASSQISSTPAEYGDDGGNDVTHVATLVVDSSLGGNSIQGNDIEVDYSSDYSISGFSDPSNVTIEVIDGSDGSTKVANGSGTGEFFEGGGSVSTSSNNVTITAGSSINNDPQFAQGDIIRIVLTGGTIDNPAEGNDERVTINAQTGTQEEDVNIDLGSSAPIAVNDTSNGNIDVNHSSLEQALASTSANNDDAIVTVRSGTFFEFNSQPTAADTGLNTASVPSSNNITVTGESGQTNEIVSTAGGSAILDTSANSDHQVSNITLEGNGILNDQAATGINNGGSDNVVINSNNILNASGTGISGGQAQDLEITNNQINDPNDGDNYDGVVATGDGTFLNISGNTIENVGTNTAITISDTANDANVIVEDNVIDGSGSGSGTGISVATSGTSNVDIGTTNSEIKNVSSGISSGATSVSGDFLNISDITLEDIGSGSGTAIDLSNVGTSNDIDISSVTINNSDQGVLLDDTGAGLAVEGGVFGEEGGALSGNAIDISSSDTDVSVNGTTIRVSGSNNGITTSSGSYTLNVTNVDITGDSSSTGININSGTTTFELDKNSDDSSTVTGVNKGLNFQAVSSVTDISNTTFTNISSIAVDIQTGLGGDLGLEDITVDGSSSVDATAVSFDDGSNDLTVRNSQLGVSNTEEVDTGIAVVSASSETVVNSTDIFVDDGSGINPQNGNSLTIDGTTIDGSDQTGIGIDIDGSTGTLNINPDNAGTIEGLNVGIDIDSAGGVLTLGSGTDIDNFGSTGIEHTASQNLTVSGAELTEDSSGGATGIDFSPSADNHRLNISSQSTIQVADDSGSTGVLIDQTKAEFNITKSTIEAVGTQSAGTGIDINAAADPVGNTVTIQFNEIIGFNKSGGNGLAGSEASNLLNENATGNYWGTEYGPDANAGSNVSSSVANDAYDPFLTADLSTQVSNAEDVDSVSGLTESDVQDFAHGLTVGAAESFAFPATSTDTQLSDIYVDNSSNVAIYEYNATSQSWELASGRPTGLDAYVASFGDDGDSMNVKIEYESEASAVDRGTYEYQDGFNYLPVTQENTSVTSDVINTTTGFDLTDPDKSDTRFASQYTGAANGIYSQTSYATVSGDNLGTPAPDLSPFQGTFVNIETTSVDDNQIAPLDPSVSLANANQTDA